MNPYIIAFITGLTTGGLSCLAVQGGLLASSLAHQIEQDLLDQAERNAKKNKKKFRLHIALPILLFLGAKVVAYTMLGLLLGAVGTALTLTPRMRAALLIAIGIFMIGNALRMFNIHPFFRIFALEPPKFVTRAIRRRAKKGADLFTPLFLGAMTMLIPCGVTQAMMAAAIATGDPIQGAGLMLAFTLGTSPVFFVLAYLTTQIGSRLEKLFTRFVAVIILILGIVTYISGLRLTGLPLSLSMGNILPGWLQTGNPTQQVVQPITIPSFITTDSIGSTTGEVIITPTEEAILSPSTEALVTSPTSESTTSAVLEVVPSPSSEAITTLTLTAQNNGYFPGTLFAPAGAPAQLNIVTENTRSCAVAFVIPVLNYQTILPETGTTTIDIPPQPPGTVIAFTCSMGMYTGEIVYK
jgi:sulfite exporter TauE/SafE